MMALSLAAEENTRVANDVRFICGAGAPSNGFTGAGVAGPSSLYFDIVNRVIYLMVGTDINNPTWASLTSSLGPGSVLTANIADGNVTTAKLAANAVGSGQLANNSVGSIQLANGAVGNTQLAANAVATSNLQDGSVTTTKLNGAVVGTGNIVAGAVVTTSIAAGAITPVLMAPNLMQQAFGTIVSTDITGTGANQLSSANGYPLVAGQGVNTWIEFISVVLFYKFVGAAYANAGGGNLNITMGAGGSTISGSVSSSVFIGGVNAQVWFNTGAFPAGTLVTNVGLYLKSGTPFTNPGTANGFMDYYVNYRVHTHS